MSTLTADAVTREDALKHIAAVEEMVEGRKISDPVAYFQEEVSDITNRLERERQLDPDSSEMKKIQGDMSREEYFSWLEGVLDFQKAYLAALGN